MTEFNFGEFTFYEANLANNHATYRRSEAWQNAFAG
jgi:hypothetical protein